jgi:hypothetical protein
MHHLVEVVDVNPKRWPAPKRHPFLCRIAAEVGQHQQTHRFALVAWTATTTGPEIEIEAL